MLAIEGKNKFGNYLILLIRSWIQTALKSELYNFRLGGRDWKGFAVSFLFFNQRLEQHLSILNAN